MCRPTVEGSLREPRVSRAFSPMAKIARNARFASQAERDKEREGASGPGLSSPLRIWSRHRDDDGAAPRRAASRRHRRRVYMQLSVRETSRRTPPAGPYFTFDFPRSFRAANRAASHHTTRRSVPVPRVSVSPPVSLYFPPRRTRRAPFDMACV